LVDEKGEGKGQFLRVGLEKGKWRNQTGWALPGQGTKVYVTSLLEKVIWEGGGSGAQEGQMTFQFVVLGCGTIVVCFVGLGVSRGENKGVGEGEKTTPLY